MMDAASFLDAIRAAPEDDAPRLIYADWLSEQPDESLVAQGEFIRAQIGSALAPTWSPEWYEAHERAETLRAAHQAAWEAPLRPLGATIEAYERGLPVHLAIMPESIVEHLAELEHLAPAWRGATLHGRGPERRAALERRAPRGLTRLGFGRAPLLDSDDVLALTQSDWLDALEEFSLAGQLLEAVPVSRLLFALVRRRAPLKALDLSYNRLHENFADLPVTSILSELQSLDLSGTSLRRGLPTLLAWCRPERLRTLRLAAADLNHTGPEPIPEAVLTTLEELDLSRNPDQAVDRLLFFGVHRFAALRTLNLSHCGLSPPPAWTPPHELKLSSLESLIMHDNQLDDAGACLIATNDFFPKLRRLNLAGNGIGPRGALALAHNTTLPLLRELDLSRNPLSVTYQFSVRASSRMTGVRLDLSKCYTPQLLL